MNTPAIPTDVQQRYLHTCGSLRNAVHAAISLSRAAWIICTESKGEKPVKEVRRLIAASEFQTVFDRVLEESKQWRNKSELVFELLIDLTCQHGICERTGNDLLALESEIANPLEPVRAALHGIRPAYELRYFVMRNIREYNECVQSSNAARALHAQADAVNDLIQRELAARPYGIRTVFDVHRHLMPELFKLKGIELNERRLFLECCRVLKFLWLSEYIGHAELRTRFIDAEYLLSRLFGLPTAIRGLDDLFGGGGLMLVEAPSRKHPNGIGGRAVLTVGPFGTGKSLLGLQMAVEVARKGGVAWVMPLEQTAEECLYALQVTCGLPNDSPFTIATTVPAALAVLEKPDPERGALILLRTLKDSFDDFVEAFDEHVRLMHRYPLRLIVVDPVSAVSQAHGDGSDVSARRTAMLRLFETVKQQGTNIWLVTEEQLPGGHSRYEQNIADTVIQVSREERHGYSQRYIEITKSRLQREQRGRHALTIGPGRGITIFPSSAAVRARIKTRTMQPPGRRITFGLPSFESILGSHGLNFGDVVVLQGPRGCAKTEVGLSFLLEPDWHGVRKARAGQLTTPRALLVSARSNEGAMHRLLERTKSLRRRRQLDQTETPPADVRIVTIGGGYINPGYILQRIEDEFREARRLRIPIGRVMIDSIPHWDSTCPYVRDDHTFGDTLIDLLRRNRVTTLVTCGQMARHAGSVLHRSVLDNADCLLQFEWVEFRGSSRVMVRVAHSRDTTHRREFFELHSDARTLTLGRCSTLLRLEAGGRVNSAKVRLFLTADSAAQMSYNATLLSLVRSVLSRDAELQIESPQRIHGAFRLASSSAIDELQIVQLEEFQLPPVQADRHESAWLVFDREFASRGDADALLPRLRNRTARRAIPYYVNVSLLAARSDVDANLLASWEALSFECQQWEREHAPEAVFFDFPKTGEDYNCLFIEIVLAMTSERPEETRKPSSVCALETWMTSDNAVDAMIVMHRLCRRAYMMSLKGDGQGATVARPDARVWRHSYTTLNQMLSGMDSGESADVTVRPLPQRVSVAGDAFLAVPAYSAASDVGPQLIRLFTTEEAEFDRLRLGIGLPTRRDFYASNGQPVKVSPYFSMDLAVLHDIVSNSFHRSTLGCYTVVSSTLQAHIKEVLAIAATDEDAVREQVRLAMNQLRCRLALIDRGSCHRCRVVRGQSGVHTS